MQPYGYQVPKSRKLGWGALGDDAADAGVVYAPPPGWTVTVGFQLVTPENQANFTAGAAWDSGDVEQYQNVPSCPVFSQAVKADPAAGMAAYMPPLGWLVGIINNGQEDQTIWIDPSSKVAYNLRDCTTGPTEEMSAGLKLQAGFDFSGVLMIAGIVAGGWLLMRYWPQGKGKSRRKARSKPRRRGRRYSRRPARRRR